jgi:hypothetical protein
VRLSYRGDMGRRIIARLVLGKKQDSIWKITKAKMTKGMAKVVEDLTSKCEAVSSNFGIAKYVSSKG